MAIMKKGGVKMKSNINLADKLKNIRLQLKLSQEYVAKHINISRSAVSEIENNKRKISVEELQLFSTLYGVSIDELLYDIEQEDTKKFAREFSQLSKEDQKEIMNLIEFKKNYKKVTM